MKVDLVPIDSVIPYARNPRKNAGAVGKVAASLREFGWRQPIVVDSEMVIIVGHTRLLAARQLGMTEVPVHVAGLLTPEQVKAYRITDNRVGEEAEWDNELLKLELGELRAGGMDLALTGFDDAELNGLLYQPVEKSRFQASGSGLTIRVHAAN
jgi:ParB-like chromosome segregation protein Spo0J